MRCSIKFHFSEDSSAFEDHPGETERLLNEALSRAKDMVLRDEIPLDGQDLPLTDVNGNKVGELHVSPQ